MVGQEFLVCTRIILQGLYKVWELQGFCFSWWYETTAETKPLYYIICSTKEETLHYMWTEGSDQPADSDSLIRPFVRVL